MKHRDHVGKMDYDLIGLLQFYALSILGLRPHHKLLDIGCGSLRAGKFFIPYLHEGNYYGIEPDKSVIDAGIRNEVDDERGATFSCSASYECGCFGKRFDFILAHSIFTHAPLGDIETCIKNAYESLKVGGMFAFTYYEGDDNKMESWCWQKVTYRKETLLSLLPDDMILCDGGRVYHPRGQRWVIHYKTNRKKNITTKEKAE